MRVVVVGTSGCGKTVFAQSLAQRIGANHIELDTLHWAENWTIRPREQFVEAVRLAAASERWVADGNYSVVRDVLWSRATHVVWLHFSRTVVFSRILWRTVQRVFTRAPLWHGNRESFAQAFFSRQSILLWSITTYSKNVRKYTQLRGEGAFAHLHWVVFRKPAEAERFLATNEPAAV
ncbi:MAG: AAA family ATPase [Burkholderiaceae bacterium]|nr:MAG: AAA family ATPase [Burkholderiaceae bacterium]